MVPEDKIEIKTQQPPNQTWKNINSKETDKQTVVMFIPMTERGGLKKNIQEMGLNTKFIEKIKFVETLVPSVAASDGTAEAEALTWDLFGWKRKR